MDPVKQSAKGKAPRKHHYVPVFYQRNFANANGLLWVYDRKFGTYKELHPDVICVEKDLYAVKHEKIPWDTSIESKLLWGIDTLGARGIHEFQTGKPNRDAEEAIAFFAAFQYFRLPTIRRDISTTFGKAIEELNRVAFANVERAQGVLDRYARETGEPITVSAESMVEAIQGKHLTLTVTEVPFLTNMMEQAVSLNEVIKALNWEVLVASDETGFIICDCPLVIVPPKGNRNVGFLVPGSVKYFPLTRGLCLRLGDSGKSRRYRTVDKETVRIINQNIAANSERFIMGPSQVQLENVVMRSASSEMESTPRFIIETFEADENGSLQKISSQPRRYFYPKNGSSFAP